MSEIDFRTKSYRQTLADGQTDKQKLTDRPKTLCIQFLKNTVIN